MVAQSVSQISQKTEMTESRASMRPTESLTDVTDLEIPESRATINNFVSNFVTNLHLKFLISSIVLVTLPREIDFTKSSTIYIKSGPKKTVHNKQRKLSSS